MNNSFYRLSMLFAAMVAALMSCALFSSCEKAILTDIDSDDGDDTEITAKETGELYVSCSFSQTQSEMTRGSSVPLADCANRVQYVIMKGETIVHNSEQINGGGSTFGKFGL